LVQAQFDAEPPANLPTRLTLRDLNQLELLEAAIETCANLEEWLALLPNDSEE
jgi:hypothetical protein